MKKKKTTKKTAEFENIRDIVLGEYAKGNIVVSTFEGLQSMPLRDFIKQPVRGMLYDLNRSESVILTFIDDPKWINDFAACKVIQELKKELEPFILDRAVLIEKNIKI